MHCGLLCYEALHHRLTNACCSRAHLRDALHQALVPDAGLVALAALIQAQVATRNYAVC